MMARLCRVTVIVSQETAEPLAALDLALRLADFVTWINQSISQSLMVPLSVIMFQELADSGAKHLLAKEDHFQEAFFLEASHETLDMRRQIGRPWRKPHAFNAFLFQDLAKRVTDYVSRSMIRYRLPTKNPSNGSVRFLAICFIHCPSGFGVQPAK